MHLRVSISQLRNIILQDFILLQQGSEESSSMSWKDSRVHLIQNHLKLGYLVRLAYSCSRISISYRI